MIPARLPWRARQRITAPVPVTTPRPSLSLRSWQTLTIGLMIVGYSGYYLCRSVLSVCLPQIAEELARGGMAPDVARIRLGMVASIGVLAYAAGKFLSGGLADLIGGRRNFLLGMGGAVLFTLLFASAGSLPIFTLAWIGNRALQSTGWVGMVKLTSRWFSYSSYSGVMGVISLSYLFGDAASRTFMAWLLALGFGWRAVFFTSAGVLGLIFAVTWGLLYDSRQELGFDETEANPENLFAAEGDEASAGGLLPLVTTLLRSPAFLFVCALSLGFTLVRETFNTWTPTYFIEALGLSQAAAASQSAWFPFFGGISVLLAGYLGDRLGSHGRPWLIFGGLIVSTAMLVVLALGDFRASSLMAVAVVAGIAFVMIGPYSYLGGALALDFGGKRGSATASGIIDGVGYLGGVVAGDGMARASVAYGWRGAFLILAAVAAVSAAFALLFLLDQRRRSAGAAADSRQKRPRAGRRTAVGLRASRRGPGGPRRHRGRPATRARRR